MADKYGLTQSKNLVALTGESKILVESDSASGSIDFALDGVKVFSVGASGAGYTTGSGGAVTQITSISTGVTLSTVCGQITTVASTLAAAAETAFTVTNTLVAATDVVVLSTTYAGAGTPLVYCKVVAAGSFDIGITNLHASAALDALLVINFAVIKAVAA